MHNRGAMKHSQSHIHTIRNLRYHVRTWGDARSPKLFLLHGWMDVSASFQFLVDCLQRDWYVVAPDWRGFGLTEWARDGYWFPDYYADLDALLDIYEPKAPVSLVAHSMGGNIAGVYAGVRPHRVAKLISLEGFGASRTKPEDAPARFERWLDEVLDPPQFGPYASFDAVAARLKKNNARLADYKALFLAQLALFLLRLHRINLILDLLALGAFHAAVGGMHGAAEILDEDCVDAQDGLGRILALHYIADGQGPFVIAVLEMQGRQHASANFVINLSRIFPFRKQRRGSSGAGTLDVLVFVVFLASLDDPVIHYRLYGIDHFTFGGCDLGGEAQAVVFGCDFLGMPATLKRRNGHQQEDDCKHHDDHD